MSIGVNEFPQMLNQATDIHSADNDHNQIGQHDGVSPQGMESFAQKVFRHVLAGAFDRRTLQHGVEYLKNWIESAGLTESMIEEISVESDFAGRLGYRRVCYGFIKKNKIHNSEWERQAHKSIFFLDLPQDITIGENSYEDDDRGIAIMHGIADMKSDPNVMGFFIGPTRISNIPNNGFFDRNFPDTAQFMDTNPPGGRRGAIAITDQGDVVLLTDDEKWRAVRNNFSGYRLVSGTSFYFTSEDTGSEQEIQQVVNRSVVSYLIQYINAEGKPQWTFCKFDILIPRLFALLVIQRHMSGIHAQSYRAVELEYVGGHCAVRTPDDSFLDIHNNPGFDFPNRSDHYFFKKKSV